MRPTEEEKAGHPGRVVVPSSPRPVDEYGFVLVAVFITLVVMGVASDHSVGRILIPLLFLGILVLTMLTSGASRWAVLMAGAALPAVAAFGAMAGVSSSPVIHALSPLASTVLVVACVVFISRRLSRHTVITRRTVFGALCIYLFAGLLFAMAYRLIAVFGGRPFFVQTAEPSGLDYIYFSFVAIATLGFGDLTPATGVGKMASIIETIAGQLYLLVVVALFVGRIGQALTSRPPTAHRRNEHERE